MEAEPTEYWPLVKIVISIRARVNMVSADTANNQLKPLLFCFELLL